MDRFRVCGTLHIGGADLVFNNCTIRQALRMIHRAVRAVISSESRQ